MFQKPSKKQLLIRRVVVAVIMTVSVLVIVTGTILFILGYRLDSENGRLEQGALVQFESTPNGADISIDGKATGSRTDAKESVMAGAHSFILTKNGYEPWAKSLDLTAGTLTWLDYVRLVPTELKTEAVASYDTLSGEKASPDGRRLILQEKSSTPSFQLIDIRDDTVRSSTLSLPKDVYSDASKKGVTHSFSVVRWDAGSRFVLLRHVHGGQTEWIVLDTENISKSTNVSRLLSLDLADLRFSGTSGRLLYGLTTDGVIRKLDLQEATISRALVTGASRFDLFETGTITYVGRDPDDDSKQVAGLYREGDSAPHVLRSVKAADASLSIATGRYFSDDYVAIAEGLKVTILKGRYPASASEDTSSLQEYAGFTASAKVNQLMFSPEGDYLIARSGLNFISYEVEHQRQTSALIQTQETKARDLQWLDPAYFWAIYDGQLSIREFDGTNTHPITSAEVGYDATLSDNEKFLYSVVKHDNQYQLQRTKLIVD